MKTIHSLVLMAGAFLVAGSVQAEAPAFIGIDVASAYGIGGETGLRVAPEMSGIAAFPSVSRSRARADGQAAAATPAAATAGIVTRDAQPAAQAADAGRKPAEQKKGVLGRKVLQRARQIGKIINSTGGYRFDGYNDCYGFVRRVWDEILSGMKKAKLPVNDYVSPAWHPIENWSKLKPGDVLATHQGHMWGARWHTGLYVGTIDGRRMIYDNSGSRDGAYVREMPAGLFKYYYGRTHDLLAAN